MTIDRWESLFYNGLRFTGRGAVRLARLLWEQEVAGSNPVAPNPCGIRTYDDSR